MKKLKNTALIATLFLILIFPVEAQESPPLPMELYGRAISFNAPVTPGTPVTALDSEGNPCGFFTVRYPGYFGVLSCIGENTTLNGTGASPGENIRFRIGGFPASILFNDSLEGIGNLSWEGGEFVNITIVSPPIVCGDGFCDNYENHLNCPEDCPAPPETTPGDPDPSDPEPAIPDFPDFADAPDIVEEEPLPEEECIESWSCSDWSECFPNGTQVRECVDVNECGTEEDMPDTVRSCVYEEPPDVERPPVEPERPLPDDVFVVEPCDERLPILSLPSLVFIILFFIIVVVPLIHLEVTRKKIIRNKYIDEMEKLKMIYHLERKTYTFLIIVSVLALIVYLYHYFFFLCEDVYYSNLWLLALFVFLSPVIIHVLISVMKYSEKAKLRKMKLLNNSYYRHVTHLIKVTNEQLARSENDITQKIYRLGQDEEFKELVTKTKEVRNIYYDMTKLFALYKEEKKATKVEKDLLANIEQLDKNDVFNEAAKEHPELDSLRADLALLYKAYESKQELYDELRRIEKSVEEEDEEDGDSEEGSGGGKSAVVNGEEAKESGEEKTPSEEKESGAGDKEGSGESSGEKKEGEETEKTDSEGKK